MESKKIDFDSVEMLQNLQADINQTLLITTLNAKTNTTIFENANNIQANINAIFKTYFDYLFNK